MTPNAPQTLVSRSDLPITGKASTPSLHHYRDHHHVRSELAIPVESPKYLPPAGCSHHIDVGWGETWLSGFPPSGTQKRKPAATT